VAQSLSVCSVEFDRWFSQTQHYAWFFWHAFLLCWLCFVRMNNTSSHVAEAQLVAADSQGLLSGSSSQAFVTASMQKFRGVAFMCVVFSEWGCQ
jgi:hypothetical protein